MPQETEGKEYSRKLTNQSQMLWHRKEIKRLSRTPNLSMPKFLFPETFYRIHPLVATLLPQSIPILPNAGRSKCFIKNRAKLKGDLTFSETVKGCNIPFIVQPEQLKALRVAIMSQEETDLINQEVREMLIKCAILIAKILTGK